MIRLGINVDHVATVRNARGEAYPNPVQAAVLAELGGADNITCHLREDRRHIRDEDVRLLKATINIPLNFEMAATEEMLAFALKLKPHAVTLVPERREEVTTEGGLDLAGQRASLAPKIARLKEAGILVSLFIEPDRATIDMASELKANAVEFHTGRFCHEMAAATRTSDQWRLMEPLIQGAQRCHELGVQAHFGHGLHYHNAHWLQAIPHCEEANIGHAVIGRAIFVGLAQAVREMKALLNDPQFKPQVLT